MLKITTCNNCPFHNSEGEYDDVCNHLKAPKYPENILEFKDDADKIPTNTTTWGFYHDETHEIPEWCPLKNVDKIFIPDEVFVEFDKRLFKDNTEGLIN